MRLSKKNSSIFISLSCRRCFAGKSTVESIISALESESGDKEWAQKTLKMLEKVSPSSLKLTLEQLNRGRNLDLRHCLEMVGRLTFVSFHLPLSLFRQEYRMSQGCMRENDFAEGVRALLVDRDNAPVWNPSSLKDVTKERIASYFSSLGGLELTLPHVDGQWSWNQNR